MPIRAEERPPFNPDTTADAVSATQSGGGNTTRWAWLPNWQTGRDTYVNTGSLSDIAKASDPGSAVYNTKVGATDSYAEWDLLDGRTKEQITALAKSLGGRSGSALWKRAIDASARTVAKGDPQSPWQILNDMASSGSPDGKKRSGGGGSSYGPFTNTGVNLTNQFDARYLVDDALNKYLGRDATPKERAAFWKQLNASEAANPQVDSGVTSKGGTSSVRQGGFNPNVAAEDFAKSRKDYAETQASTTILDWMTESIMKDQTEGLM